MCGRYTVTTMDGLIADLELSVPPGFEARYNVAPTQELPVVADRGDGPAFETMRWGLIPHWARDPGIASKLINARCETLADKPAFRDAFARRRCLVPADGFFEWTRRPGEKTKVPLWYHRADRRAFAFAGLWERWRSGADAQWTMSFTIVTGEPNELLRPYHDRMPIIVTPEDYRRWLHPEPLPPDVLEDIFAVPSAEGFELSEVSTRVNRVDHDDPACLEPYRPVQGSLF